MTFIVHGSTTITSEAPESPAGLRGAGTQHAPSGSEGGVFQPAVAEPCLVVEIFMTDTAPCARSNSLMSRKKWPPSLVPGLCMRPPFAYRAKRAACLGDARECALDLKHEHRSRRRSAAHSRQPQVEAVRSEHRSHARLRDSTPPGCFVAYATCSARSGPLRSCLPTRQPRRRPIWLLPARTCSRQVNP